MGGGLVDELSRDLEEVRPEILSLIGLRLLDLALRSSVPESVSSSISSFIGTRETAAFFLADLVTGPKYPSFDDSLVSEGVGDGEITLGVAGIRSDEDGITKGGRDGIRTVPVRIRVRSVAWRGQEVE